MSQPSKQQKVALRIHNWPQLQGCQHMEVVNTQGKRVDPRLTLDKARYEARDVRPSYDCPACTKPDESMVWMGTRPDAAPSSSGPLVSVQPNSVGPAKPGHGHQKNRHRQGEQCLLGDSRCHFHHKMEACHLHWTQCYHAKKAINASFYAKKTWTGAPVGWNAEHEKCLKSGDRCALHQKLYLDGLPVEIPQKQLG